MLVSDEIRCLAKDISKQGIEVAAWFSLSSYSKV
jgi:hypothetical protein